GYWREEGDNGGGFCVLVIGHDGEPFATMVGEVESIVDGDARCAETMASFNLEPILAYARPDMIHIH
ncbi:hypothetical protein U1Q18_034580, partial [Sarracenia purpurea var. burkii]